MSYIDTRDLETKREELKDSLLEDWNEKFENNQVDEFCQIKFELLDGDDFENIDRETIQEFKDYWEDEYKEIEEIDEVEQAVGSEFSYGCTLIDEDDFEDYCEEFCLDVGYISKDIPHLIRNNIDFEGIADDMKQDYSEVEYQGTTYLFRE